MSDPIIRSRKNRKHGSLKGGQPRGHSPKDIAQFRFSFIPNQIIDRNDCDWNKAQFPGMYHAVVFGTEPTNMEWPAVIGVVCFNKCWLIFAANFTWRFLEVVIFQQAINPAPCSVLVPIPSLTRDLSHKKIISNVPRATN